MLNNLPFSLDHFEEFQDQKSVQIENQIRQNDNTQDQQIFKKYMIDFMKIEFPEFESNQFYYIKYQPEKKKTTLLLTIDKQELILIVMNKKIIINNFSSRLLDYFPINLKLTVYEQEQQIDMVAKLCEANGETLRVDDHHLRLLMCRYFIRLNCSFRYGAFSIHPISGEITIQMNSYLGDQIFQQFLSNSENYPKVQQVKNNQNLDENEGKEQFNLFLKTAFYTIKQTINFHMPKIYHMLDRTSDGIFPFLDPPNKANAPQKQIKWPNEDSLVRLQKLLKILEEKCLLDFAKNSDSTDQQMLQYPKQQSQLGVDIRIITKIQITGDLTQMDGVGAGGFAEVQKVRLNIQTDNNTIIPKTLAVKRETKQNGDNSMDRVRHEKNILQKIQKYYIYKEYFQFRNQLMITQVDPNSKEPPIMDCAYITQFYQCEADKFQNDLFMEFYPHQSLDVFKSNFPLTMSLNTKIYILFQISQGLRFLIERKVYHLDIQPANILITQNYIAQITDFGESYNHEVCQNLEQYRPGQTLPYCPPQLADAQTQKYTSRSDVYSFGVLMDDFLFDCHPIEYKRGKINNVQTKYYHQTYQTREDADWRALQKKPKHLIKVLQNTINKCIQNEEKRPYIEWLSFITRECLTYIERMY